MAATDSAGVPWEGRGARLDEGLDALEALWGPSPAEYHGKLLTIPATHKSANVQGTIAASAFRHTAGSSVRYSR